MLGDSTMQPNELTAGAAAARIAAGTLTSEALVKACLARIEAREPAVGAWEHLDPDAAIRQAVALDRGPRRGPLHGVPVAVKDIFDTADMPTGYGSPIYAGGRPAWDAACVALLRAAGAVLLGKTVTTEFALFAPGKTKNPHNPAHTPGGSSSGSAAAVADMMAPLALGTQTAGSVIRPASFCGGVGYKPSYGLIPRAGVKQVSDTLDTVGVFARAPEDAALLVAVLSGRDAWRSPEPIAGPPRIGVCRTFEWERAEAATHAAVQEAASRFASAGARISEIALPAPFAGLGAAQRAIMGFEGAGALAHERLTHRGLLSDRLREFLDDGQRCTPSAYLEALALAKDCRRRLDTVLGDCDALLAPSAPGEAPKGLGNTGDPIFNRMWTLLHVPSVTLPGLQGPNGLPVGVQLVARQWDDARLLAVARWAAPLLG